MPLILVGRLRSTKGPKSPSSLVLGREGRMLIRRLFLGLLGAMLGGAMSLSAGWSAGAVVGCLVLGANVSLLASALVVIGQWPRASTRYAAAVRSSAADPASLPPAE